MNQVHKETLSAIENALPNRAEPTLEIFAMEGIPDDILQAHRQRILVQFQQEQAAHQAKTGNPPAGAGGTTHVAKKPKVESSTDLKKRLAEHKAKKAAEAESKQGSGDATPSQELGRSPNPYVSRPSPDSFYSYADPLQNAPSPAYVQQSYPGPQVSSPPPGFPQPYTQPPYSYPQQSPAMQPPFAQTPPQPHPAFGPPGQQYPPHGQNYTPPQQYPGSGPPFQQPFQAGPPHFGAASPATSSQYQAPPQRQSPLQNGSAPRQNNLPSAPSLPPRPNFGAPSVNAFEMQQLHHGHMPGQNGVPGHHVSPSPAQAPNPEMQKYLNEIHQVPANAKSLNGLASGATTHNSEAAATPAAQETSRPDKKATNKRTTLVYSDDEVSPEEKMASLSKYAFRPPAVHTTIGDIEG